MVHNAYSCGSSSYKWNNSWVYSTSYAQSFSSWSDRNLKMNFGSAPGLEFVKGLLPVSFTWKDPDLGDSWGFVAQDVEALCVTHSLSPEVLVDTVEDGTKYLNYTTMLAPVVKAIQDMVVQVDGVKFQSQSAVDYCADFDAKMLAKAPDAAARDTNIADLQARVTALENA
tara:strand:+ start:222 stop:731 length:510 start_codon:yes stop_codon:yes gene_type:complete